MVPSWLGEVGANGPVIAGVAVLAGSLGVPVPSLAAVVFAGALMAQGGGAGGLAACFAAGLAGAVAGDLAWYAAGRRYGGRVLGLLCRLSLSRDNCITNTAALFARRGVVILLVARFVPGLSVVSAPLAAASGVRVGRFLLFAETGAAVWVGCGLGIGYVFAGQIMDVLALLERFGIDLAATAVAGTGVYVAVRWVRRRLLLRRLRMARVSVAELAALIASGARPVIVDVRAAFQQAAEPVRIPGARSIHEEEAGARDRLQPVIVYCSCPDEVSAAVRTWEMKRFGFANVRPLRGGLAAWRAAGHPVEAIVVGGAGAGRAGVGGEVRAVLAE